LQEIHNGVTENLQLVIYRDGVQVNADGTVLVSLYDADDTTNTLLIPTASAYNAQPLGLYTLEVGPSVTYLNRVLRVVWNYSVNGSSTSQTTYTEIVTPYATISDIVNYYGFGTEPNNPNFMSSAQISMTEKLARTVINGYTQQSFGKRYGSQENFGDGSDAIFLTEPMLSVEYMYENSRLAINQSASAVAASVTYNDFGFPIELTQTNKTIRIVNVDWDVRYDNNIDPSVLYYGRFRNNSRYKFTGIIGWNYVPSDIKLAAILLTGDFLANDAAWRIKYLTEVSMSETTFKLGKGAFNGTGNILVDNILDGYRNTGIVII